MSTSSGSCQLNRTKGEVVLTLLVSKTRRVRKVDTRASGKGAQMSLLSYLLHQEDHKCELLLVNTGMGLVETLCDLHACWHAQHFQAVNLSNRSNAHQAPVLSDHKSIDCKGCNRRFHCLDTAGRRTANFGLKQQSNTNSSHHHPTPRHLGLRLTKN